MGDSISIRPSVVSLVRDHLSDQLVRKLDRYGVVIWDDSADAYGDFVSDLSLPGVELQCFKGSWYALRRDIENVLTAELEPPKLLVHLPVDRPDPDPLEELRAIGTSYRVALPTLLKQSLTDQFTVQRLANVGQQSRTLKEAEAALEHADSDTDARLISITGVSSSESIVAHFLSGQHIEMLNEPELGAVVRQTFADVLGGDYTDFTGDELRISAFCQIVLVLIYETKGQLPQELSRGFEIPSTSQCRSCRSVLEILRSDTTMRDAYIELAGQADGQLHLAVLLTWDESLASLDLTAMIEQLAITEALQLLERTKFVEARVLAVQRLTHSWWARYDAPGELNVATKLRAIATLSELTEAMTRSVPQVSSLRELTEWYKEWGWQVDSLYRRCEFIRVTARSDLREFDNLFDSTRDEYIGWLDSVLCRTSNVTSDVELDTPNLQRSIHKRYISNDTEFVAYILVDALRYELGCDLSERLSGSVAAQVAIDAAVATPPTITPVGMASLLPGSETSFEIELSDSDELLVKVGGQQIRVVRDRIGLLEHAHGSVVDLNLDDVAHSSNSSLKKRIAGASLVLVRSSEIDSHGESDLLSANWVSFNGTLDILCTAVAKLIHAGIRKVVITSDHGFLAVHQLGPDRRIDRPMTDSGDQHRRAWIGRGGTANESTVKVALADFGVGGDLDIITPRGLGVFTSGGGLQFFHGGLSPQELVVPVIAVSADEITLEPNYEISLAVAGSEITTGVIAVTVTMIADNLLTRESRVRLQLVYDGQSAAVILGGDGVDPTTGVITASVERFQVVQMQVTANLTAGSTATLEVLDAGTGVRLSDLQVNVSANVIVEDDLG